MPQTVAYPGILFRKGGCQQIQLRTEGKENGDLGAVPPLSGVLLNLQMSEIRILIRLLRVYFPRNWEFGSALSKLRNFGGRGFEPPNGPLSVRHWPQIYLISCTERINDVCHTRATLSQEKEYTTQDHHLQMCLKSSSVSDLHYVKCGVPIKEVNTGHVNDKVLKGVLL
jgi:hypothetical protein